MEAGKYTVKKLFQKDVRYIIPTFQRPYVWGQEKQWEPLWEDIRNLAERYEEALIRANNEEAQAENETETHFLGAIVLQQIPTPTSDIERRNVIDGQQRMLTLQILLDAAQVIIKQEDFHKDAKQLSKLVLNDEDFAEGDDIFKIWPTSGDRDAFRVAMANDRATDGYESSNVVKAHEFFSLQIKEWLRAVDKDQRVLKVRALKTALIGLLELVVIDLKTKDDAYIIFETLNARGTPLLASDLVKNFILQTVNAKGLDTDKIHDTYWKEFESEWWRKNIRQGRLTRPRIDVFLNYWLIARTQEEVKSHEVFPSFRDYFNNAQLEITDVMQDIQHVGNTYKQLESIAPFSPEGAFLYRWDIMQAGVITPLLLELFSASEEKLSPDRKERALKALESYLVRRMVCRMTTKDYNRLFLELISDLVDKIEKADEVVVEFLAGQEAESRLWPSDDRLTSAFTDLPLYRLLTRGRLRFVLEALEESMRTGKAEEAHVPRGTLTIEHILPQDWHKHWPILGVDDPKEYHDLANERDRLKHTVGNLTLLTNKLNPSLSNSAWSDKQEGIKEHSTLFMNKDLLSSWADTSFGEKQIKERGKKLAQLACTIWPVYS